jgi:hypothetical protein
MAHNGGRLQANTWFAGAYFDHWALNAIDMAVFGFYSTSGTTYVAQDSEYYLNSNGFPTQMPGGSADRWFKPQVWIYGAVNDTWDLEYPSSHTVTLVAVDSGFTISKSTVSAGRDRYTITAVPGSPQNYNYLCNLQITAMSGSSWTGGIKLYRTEHKSLIDAGEKFNPDFLARLGYPDNPVGTVRFMDWMATNFNWMNAYHQLASGSDCGFLDNRLSNAYYCGTASKTLNDYVTATAPPGNPSSLANGQVVQFKLPSNPTTLTITAVTRGATTTMTCTGHGLSNGKRVALAQGTGIPSDWATVMNARVTTTGLAPDYAVTVVDPNTFTIPLDSSGLTAISASFKLFPIITVAAGLLPAKRCFRVTWDNHYESEWNSSTPNPITAIYHSEFDAYIMGGDNYGGSFNSNVPVSYMIALCNKIGAHPWICMPPLMSKAGMKSIMQEVQAGLGSGLVPRFEFANEAWLNGYLNQFLAKYTYPTYNYDWNIGSYNLRYNLMCDAAEEVYGEGSSDYRIVYALQNVIGTDAYTKGLWLECTAIYGTDYPIYRADIIATAPYYNLPFTYSGSAASYTGFVDAVLAWVANDNTTAFRYFAAELRAATAEPSNTDNEPIADHITTFLPGWVTTAGSYTARRGGDLEIECYEGGPHVAPDYIDGGFPSGGATVQNVLDCWREFVLSEEAGDVLLYYFHELRKLGVKPSMYTITGKHTSSAVWGAQRFNVYPETETPMWQACMKFNNPNIALVEAL